MPLQTQTTRPVPSLGELVEHLMRFDGPPDRFLLSLLEIICKTAPATNAAILRPTRDERVDVIAAHPKPEPNQAPVWLAKAVQLAARHIAAPQAVIEPYASPDQLYGQSSGEYLVVAPIRHPDTKTSGRLLAAFRIRAGSDPAAVALRDRLELLTTMMVVYEMRQVMQARSRNLDRLQGAMEVVAAIGEQPRFQAAAMGLCNQVAARWNAERVSLGFHRGRYIKLRAMSHTEKFTRKMKLAQDIESAMEECFDQDAEVVHPAPQDATFVSRAHDDLAVTHGPTTVISLPLRQEGDAVAVLSLERRVEQPWESAEVETLRLMCDLAAPWLTYLHDKDRWFGARWADGVKDGARKLVGPTHTWAKLSAIAVALVLAFLIFAHGEYQVDAPFSFQASTKQLVPAPFDSYLQKLAIVGEDEEGNPIYVTEDTPVRAGQLLAVLDTTRLRREQDTLMSDLTRFQKQAQVAMRDGKTVEKQIAEAEAEKVRARLRLIEYQLQQAEIRAPADGVVIRGDHRQQIGAPVSTGDVLFEIAPLRARPLTLTVANADARRLDPGMGGRITLAHDIALPFAVDRVDAPGEETTTVAVRLLDSEDLQVHEALLRADATGTARLTFDAAAPIENVSYHVGRLNTLEAELEVDEADIGDVAVGDRGSLAAASHPGHYLDFEVVRISPVAEVVEQRNVFRVTVKLLDSNDLSTTRRWAKPGVEGLAKIDKGQRPYIAIWTKDLIEWVRMKLWI